MRKISNENAEIILRDLEGIKNDIEELHRVRNELAGKIKNVEVRILVKWNEMKEAISNSKGGDSNGTG